VTPILYGERLHVISFGFFLPNTEEAVIWRGPMKIGAIQQFIRDVRWGDLDYLIIDSPPGTGDEPLTVAQSIPGADGAIVVTTPQDVAVADVRRSITFCRTLQLPVLGVVENMSGLICPHCDKEITVFKTGGAERMAREMEVEFLTSLPLEPAVVEASDAGHPVVLEHPHSRTAEGLRLVVAKLLELPVQAETGS
jgi:Mrp family chromosome partitioning ATPase